MRKYLLWDHDGVLVDTERWYFAATRDSLAQLGIQVDERTYLDLMADGRACWELAEQAGISQDCIVHARRDRDARYQQYLLTKHIEVEGVLDVLSALKPHYRMAIVTTSKRCDFDLIHHSRAVRSFFDFVLTVEDCTNSKPHPEPYLKALELFDARPQEALAIEDSARGLRAAIAAGLECIVIRNPFTASQDFSRAFGVLNSVRELPAALAAIV
jgi:HAD superfamily hydrolase (TIGR01509 family)